MNSKQNTSKRMARFFVAATILLLNSVCLFAQSQVTGVVSDNTGEPLIGVNVVEKGTTNGTVTDMDGKFSIQVAQGKVLQISYIGYKSQEITVKGRTLNITLAEDSEMLEDVVVIGYGSMTRKDVTSSITTVSAEKLNKGAYTDPSQLLQGKVPGLTISQTSDPSGSSSISLRGASSLREGEAMEPYYVIDGVPGVSLSLVSPDDIESIDVLRDATATAIYGSKAANGVIIVTTKRGKKGEKASVTYSTYVAGESAMRNLKMMTATELRKYAADNNFALPNDLGADTDWQKLVQRTGFTHSHNVSISGGSEKTQYSASLNYFDRKGIIRNTNRDRLTARSFVQTKALNDRLELSVSLNASVTNNHSVPTNGDGASAYNAMYYFSPLQPATNEDGSWYDGTGVTSMNYNPMSIINENTRFMKDKFLQGVGKAALNIVDGLVWNLTLSYQNHQYLFNGYDSTKSQIGNTASLHGRADRNAMESQKKQLETYVNYDHTFADKHKLALMAGYSWEQSDDRDGFGFSVYNFYDDSMSYYNMGLANNMNIADINSRFQLSTLRMISFYGRVNYSFNSKYLFQATIRRDGSSAFGVNNRWGTFPSASLAWRVTEEGFMKNQNVFDDLKFRVGYGVSGNSLGFDAYTARLTYGPSGWFQYTDANGNTSMYRTLAATHNANPDLKWERTGMFNVGVDFAFLNNRLSGTLEYYDKRTNDLIYSYPVSTTRYPYGYMDANVGSISNKGIELTINATPVRTKNFNWDTSINLSHNVNKVTKMSNSLYSTDYVNMGNPSIGGYSFVNVQRLQEGCPIGQFYVWEWAGYDEGGASIFNDYDKDGNLIGTTGDPQEEDRVAKGSAQPKMTFGWNNTLTYKKWSLTAFFQGVVGNKIFNGTRAYFSSINLITTGKNALAEVITEQKFTDARSQAPSDRYLENGSYMRLANLQLGYDFGRLGKWVNSLRVYGSCNNVFTLTKYSGQDPEINLGGLTPGIDNRETRYPRARTFMFGVNVNF